MKNSPDRFSDKSGFYKKYRPDYPAEMLEEIINLVEKRSCSWDCGTGNGQVARILARYFDKVHASDISKEQIDQAYTSANIEYHVRRAEESGFEPDSFNLITVAQALHWFDTDAFFKEVRRVAAPGAILAAWGYGLLRFGDQTDELINDFYLNTVGPYWDPQRKHVEDGYRRIEFPFKEIMLNRKYEILTEFNRESFIGYLATWSSVRNYIAEKGFDPVEGLKKRLATLWPEDIIKTASFPVFYRIGIVEK